MGNPREWFRRRRATSGGAEQDPFFEEDVLDLGRDAVVLREEAPHSVPPPPRPVESGRLIRASAFTVRPELAWREPARAPERAAPVPPAPTPPAPTPPAPMIAPSLRIAAPVRELAIESVAVRRRAEREAPHEIAKAPSPPLGIERPSPPPQPLRPPAPEIVERRPAAPIAAAKPPAPEIAAPRAPEPKPAAAAKPPGENAAFSIAAPGPTWMRGPTGRQEGGQASALLREAFTPTRPKHDVTLFSGRFREMQRIIAAIEEERAHVVVYGERGSGKTSLCNILAGKATEAGYLVVPFACTSGVSFEEIFRSVLRRIPPSFLSEGLGSRARVENFAQLLPDRPVGVGELIEAFARIHERHVIVIIDEYDRVVSDEVKSRLAELIKIMSDALVPVTLLLIGVADDVRELFGKHPSLQRTLVTVPMPLMTRRELEGLIAAGEARAELTFQPTVRDAIVEFAQGLPYHAQLLCLMAARSAIRRQSRDVAPEDFRYAVERAAEEAEARIREAYLLAVGTPAEPAFEDALYRAARAKSDEFGSFTAADVAAVVGDDALPALQASLKTLLGAERGAVLRRIDRADGERYQFASQMLRHYVLVRQVLQRGLI